MAPPKVSRTERWFHETASGTSSGGHDPKAGRWNSERCRCCLERITSHRCATVRTDAFEADRASANDRLSAVLGSVSLDGKWVGLLAATSSRVVLTDYRLRLPHDPPH